MNLPTHRGWLWPNPDEAVSDFARKGSTRKDEIRNFNEEATFNIISNNYHDHSSSVNYQFNPIEKIVELYQEKIALYERMLTEKDALIEKLMQKK